MLLQHVNNADVVYNLHNGDKWTIFHAFPGKNSPNLSYPAIILSADTAVVVYSTQYPSVVVRRPLIHVCFYFNNLLNVLIP